MEDFGATEANVYADFNNCRVNPTDGKHYGEPIPVCIRRKYNETFLVLCSGTHINNNILILTLDILYTTIYICYCICEYICLTN